MRKTHRTNRRTAALRDEATPAGKPVSKEPLPWSTPRGCSPGRAAPVGAWGREGAGEHAGGAASEDKRGKDMDCHVAAQRLLAMTVKVKTTFGASVSTTTTRRSLGTLFQHLPLPMIPIVAPADQ